MSITKDPTFLILVDALGFDEQLCHYWEISRFWERIESLNIDYVIWNSKEYELNNFEIAADVLHTSEELVKYVNQRDLNVIIYIEGTQLFVDIGLIKNAIQQFNEYSPDYFSQLEHSRLPVGIGVRLLSVESMCSSEVLSPKEYIDIVREGSGGFSVRYDDTHYATYNESLLDSRYSSALLKCFDDGHIDFSWDLNGFRHLARKCSAKIPKYTPLSKHSMVDERKMQAPYGFESAECAEFPTYIMFDITNVCNSECIHCPHSVTYSETNAKPLYLEVDIFKKVIDECTGMPLQFIRITSDGEPLIHPELFEMIDYAVKKGVGPLGLTTNGSLLTKDKAKRLSESGLFMVDISLDAFRKETYNKVRYGLPFDKVIDNIKYLLDYKKKVNAPLKVMVSFVKQEDNIGELESFKNYWGPLVDKVLIREMISNVNLIDMPVTERNKGAKRWPCPHWFRRIVINYNGVIKACPIDWENGTAYRHISETTVYDAWHSDFYWKNRMEHLNNQFSENSLCLNCNDWEGSPWGLGYEKVVESL